MNKLITIRKGLDIPLAGNPDQVIQNKVSVNEVAVVGFSFNELKPTIKVKEGEQVVKGQVLFTDKKYPEIAFTSPVSGAVKVVHRGEKRKFLSMVLTVDHSSTQSISFNTYTAEQLKSNKEKLKEQLLASGLWTSLKTRPFGNLANPRETPHSLFINAHDTNPGHPCPNVILNQAQNEFNFGLQVLAAVFSDVEFKYVIGDANFNLPEVQDFRYYQFAGPHPAGLVGTHINALNPVSLAKQAWHLNYQDVISIGRLFLTGTLDGTKVIALSGPQVANPTLLRVPYGASVADITFNQLKEGENRIISGSVLDGVTAEGPYAYVGHYDLQLSVVKEGTEQELFGWVLPQPKKFSLSRLSIFGKNNLSLTTSTNGSPRSMVPIGLYERVVPLDIFPTLLLRDILSNDTDSAQDNGILELVEEDVALCSFVCQGKYDYSYYLRKALSKIEKEG